MEALYNKSLVFFSGGIDSTEALLKAIECSGKVDAVFVNFVARTETQRRYMQQQQHAAEQIIDNLGRSNVKLKVLDSSLTCNITRPIIAATMTVADFYMINGPYQAVWFGNDSHDQTMPIISHCKSIINAYCTMNELMKFIPPQYVYPQQKDINQSNKQNRRQFLGDLEQLTWTCPFPTDKYTPCGRCEKCKERYRVEA